MEAIKKKRIYIILTVIVLGLLISAILYFYIMQLSQPEIFKGVRLGMDYDSAKDTLIKNEGCERVINPEFLCKFNIDYSIGQRYGSLSYLGESGSCQFKITSEIYACPRLFKAKYKGKEIVCYAILLFHSPYRFEQITVKQGEDLNGFTRLKTYSGMPAVDKGQMNELISMFEKKYGAKKSKCPNGEYCWESDDLTIELFFKKYGDQIDIGGELDVEAYQVFALYRYNDKMNKLIEYSKISESGEVIGDKI